MNPLQCRLDLRGAQGDPIATRRFNIESETIYAPQIRLFNLILHKNVLVEKYTFRRNWSTCWTCLKSPAWEASGVFAYEYPVPTGESTNNMLASWKLITKVKITEITTSSWYYQSGTNHSHHLCPWVGIQVQSRQAPIVLHYLEIYWTYKTSHSHEIFCSLFKQTTEICEMVFNHLPIS